MSGCEYLNRQCPALDQSRAREAELEAERDRYREALTWMGRYVNCTDQELRENGWSRDGCLAHARRLTDLL